MTQEQEDDTIEGIKLPESRDALIMTLTDPPIAWSYNEIAQALDVSRNVVSGVIYRTRQRERRAQ